MEKQQRSKNSFIIKTRTPKQLINSLSPKQQSHRQHPKLPEIVEYKQTLFKLKSFSKKRQENYNNKRCRSSESSYEGTLNKRYYYMFQIIPYHGTSYQRHQFYVKKWRKLIIAIQSIIYISKVAVQEFKIRSSCPPKMMISHYSIHQHPYPQSPPNRKRNKSCNLDIKNRKISFGEKIQTLIIQQKVKADSCKNSSYLQQIKNQNTKLNRLLNQKAISQQSLHTTMDFKPLLSVYMIDHLEKQSNLQKQTKKLSLKLKRSQ
ncbi:unnamed protein product [Paramecium primaurelia]|uniref:Uncharacterized protein n=1 Tax=Paramecium primaurelia TaxID=5886 RepID=A0A8S1KJR5_PARPR|nr:unnamed protein product [Paramecium primaurelia]